MSKPTAAQERAGPIGAKMAEDMVSKLTGAIDGFPAVASGETTADEQRSAIASLVAEGMETYSDDVLGAGPR